MCSTYDVSEEKGLVAALEQVNLREIKARIHFRVQSAVLATQKTVPAINVEINVKHVILEACYN